MDETPTVTFRDFDDDDDEVTRPDIPCLIKKKSGEFVIGSMLRPAEEQTEETG